LEQIAWETRCESTAKLGETAHSLDNWSTGEICRVGSHLGAGTVMFAERTPSSRVMTTRTNAHCGSYITASTIRRVECNSLYIQYFVTHAANSIRLMQGHYSAYTDLTILKAKPYSKRNQIRQGATMTFPHSACMRHDSALTEIVQCGILLQDISGRTEAHHFLTIRGVRPDIIERVLSHPEKRRVLAGRPKQRNPISS
jgi:hypothetical protein